MAYIGTTFFNFKGAKMSKIVHWSSCSQLSKSFLFLALLKNFITDKNIGYDIKCYLNIQCYLPLLIVYILCHLQILLIKNSIFSEYYLYPIVPHNT